MISVDFGAMLGPKIERKYIQKGIPKRMEKEWAARWQKNLFQDAKMGPTIIEPSYFGPQVASGGVGGETTKQPKGSLSHHAIGPNARRIYLLIYLFI